MRNKFTFDFKDNPDLVKAFADLKPGDKTTIELELFVDNITEEGMVGTIESVTPEGADDDEDAEPVKPTTKTPVMLAVQSSPPSANAPMDVPMPNNTRPPMAMPMPGVGGGMMGGLQTDADRMM